MPSHNIILNINFFSFIFKVFYDLGCKKFVVYNNISLFDNQALWVAKDGPFHFCENGRLLLPTRPYTRDAAAHYTIWADLDLFYVAITSCSNFMGGSKLSFEFCKIWETVIWLYLVFASLAKWQANKYCN